jgi:hypothetical protein
VSVLCRGRAWRRAQAGVLGLASAAAVAWAVAWWGHGSSAFTGAMPALLAGFAAGMALLVLLLRQPAPAATELTWDGRQWLTDHEPCQAELMLQTRRFLLVRLQAVRGRGWLAVERAESGAAWHGLLVALHAHPPAGGAEAEGQGQRCR